MKRTRKLPRTAWLVCKAYANKRLRATYIKIYPIIIKMASEDTTLRKLHHTIRYFKRMNRLSK